MDKDTVYSSRSPLEVASPDALVLHCSDHRFQASFRDFLTEGLGLHSYGLIAIPGGGHFISMELLLPKFSKVGLQSVSFMVKRGKPRKIVLVGHDDCLFFKDRVQFFFMEADLNQKQFANLRKARSVIAERFPDIPVELYFADARPDGSIQFVRV